MRFLIVTAILTALACHARVFVDGLPKDVRAGALDVDAWINTDGRIELEQLKGKPVILEFWSRDCPPCVKKIPQIQKMARDYGDDVHVVTVHVGLKGPTDEASVRRFVEDNGITYPVGVDRDGKQWQNFHFHYLPHMVLIDAEGRVQWSGNLVVRNAEKAVRKVIGEPKQDTELEALPELPVESCEGGVCTR